MNTTKIKGLLLLTAFALFAGGCSMVGRYQIKSEDTNIDYYQGKEIVCKEDTTASLCFNYERQEHKRFVFYLYIKNTSSTEYTIDPGRIYMQIHKGPQTSMTYVDSIPAYNPEGQLAALNKEQSDLEEGHSILTGLMTGLAAVNLVVDIAHDPGDIPEDMFHWGAAIHNENVRYEIEKNELNAQQHYWANEVLRKTTLYPGDEVGGLIYLPVVKNDGYMRVIVPVAEKHYEFYYKQDRVW